MNESVQLSLKPFDMSLEKLRLDYLIILTFFVEATIQVLYDIGLYYKLVEKDEVLKKIIFFIKRQKGELGLDLKKKVISSVKLVNKCFLRKKSTSKLKRTEPKIKLKKNNS